MTSRPLTRRLGWPLRLVLVTGPSMTPALRHGDVLLVRRSRRGRPPRTGTVVLVDLPDGPVGVRRLPRVEPEGGVWRGGDTPFGSPDSRQLGALPADSVRARVVGRLWPRP